jgi:hypothetical protein
MTINYRVQLGMKRAIGVLFLLVVTNSVFAQKEITKQSLVWYGLFTTLEFNDKWYFQNEIQERHFINPTAQHQFIVRSHLHRVLGNSGWEVSAGGCLFLTNPNEPNASVKLAVPEVRPHIIFVYKQNLDKVALEHRFRGEARFFHNLNDNKRELEDGFEFSSYRITYRLQGTVPLFKMDEQRKLKLKLYDELFINAGNKIVTNVFDQNRVYAGLNYDILKNLSFEVGYLNWFQQKPDGDFLNRDILRFTVFHKLNLRKKNL